MLIIVLLLILAFLILTGLLVGCVLSVGIGVVLSNLKGFRWVAPLFTIVIPLTLLGAFVCARYVDVPAELAFLSFPLQLIVGSGIGFCLGGLLALGSWLLLYKSKRKLAFDQLDKPK